MFKTVRTKHLDALEVLLVEDSIAEFPLHYHETLCVSLIEKGTFIENHTIAVQDSLLISNPLEVHRNQALPDIRYSLRTFYVSPDVLRFAAQTPENFLLPKIITDPYLVRQGRTLIAQLFGVPAKTTIEPSFEEAFLRFLAGLSAFQQAGVEVPEEPGWVHEVKGHIMASIAEKIRLDILTKIAGVEKYRLVRNFRKHTGLTPFQFVVLQRVLRGKEMLRQGKPIVHAAVDAGFYDQSNFTNYFRQYVGITPKVYQSSCNIFQD
jgi:AraC-like DNA-binding protein